MTVIVTIIKLSSPASIPGPCWISQEHCSEQGSTSRTGCSSDHSISRDYLRHQTNFFYILLL